MLRKEEVRLIVNLDDLRDYNREYADGSVHEPHTHVSTFSAILCDTAATSAVQKSRGWDGRRASCSDGQAADGRDSGLVLELTVAHTFCSLRADFSSSRARSLPLSMLLSSLWWMCSMTLSRTRSSASNVSPPSRAQPSSSHELKLTTRLARHPARLSLCRTSRIVWREPRQPAHTEIRPARQDGQLGGNRDPM